MAFITREYYKLLKDNKVIGHGDWVNMARMSQETGMKQGKGYAPHTFRNAVVNGFTTVEEIAELVQGYYTPKLEAAIKQRELVKQMKKKFQNI